jgi:hypothetical protein
MRKYPKFVIRQSIPIVNLDIGTEFTLSNADSTPDNQKYHVDDIKEDTLCTLVYVKGMMLRTIEVTDTIVMHARIMHSRPILSKCAVIERRKVVSSRTWTIQMKRRGL